jgi:HAE1 family hydrophobic/amphiphilic exporter-1
MIPTIAVPISLCVAFGLMYVMGYGIDDVTLLGLTHRRRPGGGRRHRGAGGALSATSRKAWRRCRRPSRARKEIGFTVLSITLSLVAVFLPILLMGGVVGRIFNAFAATVVALGHRLLRRAR